MDSVRWEHIIKFTKHHYGKWDDQEQMMKMLKNIHAEICGIPIEYSNKFDLLDIILQIIHEHFNKHQYHRLLQELFDREHNAILASRELKTIEDKIEFLLIRIQLLEVKDNESDVIMTLGENDKDIERRINIRICG
mgnify:FL=1